MKSSVAPKAKPGAPQPEKPKNAKLSPREISKEIGRYERMVEEAEGKIAESEAALVALEHTLGNLPADADIIALTSAHATIKSEIEARYAEWETCSTRLEELRMLQN
jgi:hypothetical protein